VSHNLGYHPTTTTIVPHMTARIEISYGELLDKITILEIKSERIAESAKLANVSAELAALNAAWVEIPGQAQSEELSTLRTELKATNEKLWEIEDDIRELERQQSFDETFIALARSVYFTNDRRAALKKRVDQCLGSRFSEEKSYKPY
jgi:predicted  nucleic acid-binding Zn-ribbon protein